MQPATSSYPYLQEFIQALRDEIKALESKGSTTIRVSRGMLTKIEGGEYVYSFVLDETIIASDDQPIEIKLSNRSYKAVLIGKVGNAILVSTKDNLGEKIENATLIISPVFLLEALINVIETAPTRENYNFNFPHIMIGKRQLSAPSPAVDMLTSDIELNGGQKDAVRAALGNKLTFIWGPPGTGKTTVIGKIVENLLLKKERVLITSHTNIAVDTALHDVLKSSGNKEHYDKGKMLRYGIHQLSALDNYPLIFGPNIVTKNSENLLGRISAIDVEDAKLVIKNKSIELDLDSLRLIEKLLSDKKAITLKLSELKYKEEATLKTISSLEGRRSLVEDHLHKAKTNSWLKNILQGTNVKRLLESLNQIDRDLMSQKQLVKEQQQQYKLLSSNLESVINELGMAGKNIDLENVTTVKLVWELEFNLKKIDNLRQERRSIREQIDQMSKLVLNAAQVVATTLTKCYLRPDMLAQKFDLVIIDEVSMSQIPQLFIAMGARQKSCSRRGFSSVAPNRTK
jgi:AAA domain-containing protein